MWQASNHMDAGEQNQNWNRSRSHMQRQEYANSPSDYEALKKTVYGQASNESRETQMGVAFVVMNRVRANRDYWGGSSITAVCWQPGQFCLGIVGEPQINDWNMYNSIDEWLPSVINGSAHDLTNGADHFLPHWEHKGWLSGVNHVASHGNLKFYRTK